MSALLSLLFLGHAAYAVPAQFTHQGRLVDAAGVPRSGEVNITFRVTNAVSDGTVLWEEPIRVGLTNGFYATVLGANETENPLDTHVLGQSPLWLEVQVEGEVAMSPRSPIHAVPYASMAGVAKNMDGGAVNATQISVDGSPVVNASGEWVGPAPVTQWVNIEDIPADFADGIDDDSDTLLDLSTECFANETPHWDAVLERWQCAEDAVRSDDDIVTLASTVAADSGVPSGGIIMWAGDDVPDGWKLCDGTGGTPDLRDRFVMGSGGSHTTGATGGGGSGIVDVTRRHTAGSSPDIGGSFAAVSDISLSVPNPPFYALAFIQKD